MSTSRTTAAAAALGLTVVLVGGLGPMSPADAAGRDYRTVVSLSKARLQACKAPLKKGDKFKVYVRLDNSRSRPAVEVKGEVTVQKDGVDTAQRYRTDWVRGGKVSKVGSVVIKVDQHFQLEFAVSEHDSGTGGSFSLRQLHRC